jgi:hypothetical protein
MASLDLSAAAVDKVITDIHHNVIANSVRGGYINFLGPEGLIGPPSASSLEKLREIRSSYGWEIYPEIH